MAKALCAPCTKVTVKKTSNCMSKQVDKLNKFNCWPGLQVNLSLAGVASPKVMYDVHNEMAESFTASLSAQG